MTMRSHIHGASLPAPDEGFVSGESPPPGPVAVLPEIVQR